MAFLSINYNSEILNRPTNINVILPTSKMKDSSQTYKVMYLLHGAFGDYSDWMRYTGIERYVEDKNIVVVMPSVHNSYYQDMYFGDSYYKYITEELFSFIETSFPVSLKREDTFVAGLSMGGYGAFKIALLNQDKFSKAVSLSGALDTDETLKRLDTRINNYNSWKKLIFGENETNKSDYDLIAILEDNHKNVPELFMSCGKQDFLFDSNVEMYEKFKKFNLKMKYIEDEGDHNWEFWDKYIQEAIKWLLA